jgi:hypothetical protein
MFFFTFFLIYPKNQFSKIKIIFLCFRIPGKKKVTRDSCLVKGFWGDILISPYIGFGVETDYEPEK